MREQASQFRDGLIETRTVGGDSRDSGSQRVWLTSREAQVYVGCKSLKGWYAWRVRHGIVARNNGTVSRLDLDRALRVPRKRRAMAANSLRNLRRHGSQSAGTVEPRPLDSIQRKDGA